MDRDTPETSTEERTKTAADSEAPPPAAAGAPVDPEVLRPRVVEVLKTVYDPEIPVNIYELGLIYGIEIDPATGGTAVTMTLTSPHCPAAATLPAEVESKVRKVEGVSASKVNLVWEPPWGKDMMTEAAKLALGID